MKEPEIGYVTQVNKYDKPEYREASKSSQYSLSVDILTLSDEEYHNVPIATPATFLSSPGMVFVPYEGVKVLVIHTQDGPIVAGFVPNQDAWDGFSGESSYKAQGTIEISFPTGARMSVGKHMASLSGGPSAVVLLDGSKGIIYRIASSIIEATPGHVDSYRIVQDDKYEHQKRVHKTISPTRGNNDKLMLKEGFTGDRWTWSQSTQNDYQAVEVKSSSNEFHLKVFHRIPKSPDDIPTTEDVTMKLGLRDFTSSEYPEYIETSDPRFLPQFRANSEDAKFHTREEDEYYVDEFEVIVRPGELHLKGPASEVVIGPNIELITKGKIYIEGAEIIQSTPEVLTGRSNKTEQR